MVAMGNSGVHHPRSGNAVRFIYKTLVISYKPLYINTHITIPDNCGNPSHKHLCFQRVRKHWAPFGRSALLPILDSRERTLCKRDRNENKQKTKQSSKIKMTRRLFNNSAFTN